MNQEKIGKFICQCRKEKRLTQEQLSVKLNITSKAISKWERGKCLPDSSIMIDLCNILNITVNELLSGEKVLKENILSKSEENLIKLSKAKEASIKATKYGYIFINCVLIFLIIYNLFKYGIDKAIIKPEFLVLMITGIVFDFVYLITLRKNK